MFKNRSIQVKLVKDQDLVVGDDTLEPLTVDAAADIALESVEKVLKGAAIIVGTYLVADTLRKITIHIVATKIH